MIKTDSYYEIGAGHIFCQDYAKSGSFIVDDKRYHYAIVADGCSNSMDTDVGARVLTYHFINAARFLIRNGQIDSLKVELGLAILDGTFSLPWNRMFPDETLLDSTIVALLYDELNDNLYSFCWGDGSLYFKYKSNDGYLTKISFDSNAPFYLSYLRNAERRQEYERVFGTKFGTRAGYIVTPTHLTEVPETVESGVKFHYEKYSDASKNLAFASVFSDGIDTFHKKDNSNMTMANHVLFGELGGYKNFHGEFVKRRMIAFKRQCAKDGWQHFDDISVATINFI